jgi:hypothetical protein
LSKFIFKQQKGAKLGFANIDQDGARSDAVVVDKLGNVFYGERMQLAKVNPQEVQLVDLSRQFPGQGLTIKRLP